VQAERFEVAHPKTALGMASAAAFEDPRLEMSFVS
jgi:hypothetical protein